MEIRLRIHVTCTSCYAERMVDIKFYHDSFGEQRVKWQTFKCHMCGFDEFFALPKFDIPEKQEG